MLLNGNRKDEPSVRDHERREPRAVHSKRFAQREFDWFPTTSELLRVFVPLLQREPAPADDDDTLWISPHDSVAILYTPRLGIY